MKNLNYYEMSAYIISGDFNQARRDGVDSFIYFENGTFWQNLSGKISSYGVSMEDLSSSDWTVYNA